MPKTCQTPQSCSSRHAKLLSLLLIAAFSFGVHASSKNELHVCDDVKAPPTLDPHKQFTEKNHTLLQQIFEGLVRFDPEGKIEPMLAVSWKRLSPLAMEFKLRKGVTFHNGEPFNAESVKFTIERYLNPNTGFPAIGFISSIKEVVVADPFTISIKTHFPDGLLLNRLAGYILIAPKMYVERNGEKALDRNPIGTGPFKFKAWTKNKEGIRLEANANYWDPGRPRMQKLVMHFIPQEKQVGALLTGKIDILTTLPGTQTLTVQKNPNTYVIKKPTFYTVASNFNLSRKPTSNKRVRQALNMAVNRADIIRYDLLGNGQPIAAMSMPGQFGHNPRLKPYPYDLEQAKKILREEGYPEGFTLNVLVKEDGRRTAQIMAKHLSQVGVNLKCTFVPDAELVQSLQNKNQWDVVIGDCPDPLYHSYFIQAAFLHSKSPFSLSANEQFDKRIQEMSMMLDEKRQRLLAEELDRFVYEEALGLFGYQQIRTFGVKKGVKFEPYKSGMHYFDTATLEEL